MFSRFDKLRLVTDRQTDTAGHRIYRASDLAQMVGATLSKSFLV